MKLLSRSLLSLALVFLACENSHAQTITPAYLAKLEVRHQACLDSGTRMLDCATEYYATMDNLLNVVYSKLRAGMTPDQKAALKAEQLAWLKRRDALGARVKRENQRDGLDGSDGYMVVYDRQAEFVRDRILELLKR